MRYSQAMQWLLMPSILLLSCNIGLAKAALGQTHVVNNCEQPVSCKAVLGDVPEPQDWTSVPAGKNLTLPFSNTAINQGTMLKCSFESAQNQFSGFEYAYNENDVHFDLSNIDANKLGWAPPFTDTGMTIEIENKSDADKNEPLHCRGAVCAPGKNPCPGIYNVDGTTDATTAERACSTGVNLVWTLCSGPVSSSDPANPTPTPAAPALTFRSRIRRD